MQKLWFKCIRWGQARIEKGAWFLMPLGAIWGIISFLKNWAYDQKVLKSIRVDCPVVSIGNIVAGGTGKTPFVQLLANRFSHRKVAILSRGYGMDEPLLLQRRCPHAKVYVGKDRVRLAMIAAKEGAELILLDDGLQYRKLHRDFEFILLSGEDPLGKGHYLPRGFLRDSPKRLQKADLILVSGASPHLFVFPHVALRVKVDRVLDILGRPFSLTGKKVALFSGIARPGAFRKTVENLGATIIFETRLADHEPITEVALQRMAVQAQRMSLDAIVCTEKDIVKISNISCKPPLVFVEISLEVTQGNPSLENLIAKIDQTIDTLDHYER